MNKVHFQFFSVPINAKKISNSDLNRGKIIAVAKFSKAGFLENQGFGFPEI
jgi:hypothetical protein